ARPAEQLLAGAVEPDEHVIFGALDEDHVRDVLDDGIEEPAHLAELSLDVRSRFRGHLRLVRFGPRLAHVGPISRSRQWWQLTTIAAIAQRLSHVDRCARGCTTRGPG